MPLLKQQYKAPPPLSHSWPVAAQGCFYGKVLLPTLGTEKGDNYYMKYVQYAAMPEELNDLEDSGNKGKPTESAASLNYLASPRFLIYVSCALSLWGDQMWHFAIFVFLIELYGHNLLLTAVFGLVVAGSVLVFGFLIGDWIDRKPRNKVAHASLFVQNSSVTACCIVLMLVFSYKSEIEQIWHGWLTVVCYAVVIILTDLANVASTALTITIQRDWIVVLTGDDRGHLAGMNATVRRMDQVINIFAHLSVGEVMTWASNVIGCGFILSWNVVSLLVEFTFLSKVYQLVPQLTLKPHQQTGEYSLENQLEFKNIQGFWSFDLTVENIPGECYVPESERGTVNRVQSSMNYLMDLVHFILVSFVCDISSYDSVVMFLNLQSTPTLQYITLLPFFMH
ncbi:solute carrier family 40 member 1-like [Ornithorhynchus anatinus]|uniref:solute carrier family 40 member 1-like n=1 Tax=Ornithorhynchus anatinus TaxID=9258 RepID=UPI0010A7971A|nr:solute carrier family 40 member 1-like [Ornithorhynchus anatinus]